MELIIVYTMMFGSHVAIVLLLSNVSVYTIMLSPYLPGAPNRGRGLRGGLQPPSDFWRGLNTCQPPPLILRGFFC